MSGTASTLTRPDRAALDLESQVWRYAGAKEDAIRSRLGVSPVRHHQRIARLIDDPAAAAYAPGTVRRLRAVLAHGRPRSSRGRTAATPTGTDPGDRGAGAVLDGPGVLGAAVGVASGP